MQSVRFQFMFPILDNLNEYLQKSRKLQTDHN